MIEFVCTPPTFKNCIKGYHGNHAIWQGPNVFIFQKHCFLTHGVPRNNLAPIKIVMGCNVGQIRFCGIGYFISVLI